MQSLQLWGRVEYSRLLLGSVFSRQGFGLYLEVANSLRMTSDIKKMLLYHSMVCVYTYVHAPWHVALVLSLHIYMASRDQPQFVRLVSLDGKHPYPLSHLAGPFLFFPF